MPRARREHDPDLLPPPKADETIRLRITARMKEQLKAAITDDFDGNYSRFFMECARAAIMHHRRKERVSVPVEFVTAK